MRMNSLFYLDIDHHLNKMHLSLSIGRKSKGQRQRLTWPGDEDKSHSPDMFLVSLSESLSTSGDVPGVGTELAWMERIAL
jgi:hypothetical protein